jgi:hypothetical protein
MDKVFKLAKDNLKLAVTVVLFGVSVTVGWAKGCTMEVDGNPAVVSPADAAE